jgi:hypothetical protein
MENLKIYFVLLNGPPRSGKSSSGKELQKLFNHTYPSFEVIRTGFANMLKNAVHGLYNIYDLQGKLVEYDYFEDVKDVPNNLFGGMSPRQAYIYTSERVLKKLHGQTYFGEVLISHSYFKEIYMTRSSTLIVIVEDSGFLSELIPIYNKYGFENTQLFRLHREGFTFKDDSRSYIYTKNIVHYEDTTIVPYRIGKTKLDLSIAIPKTFSDVDIYVKEGDIAAIADRIFYTLVKNFNFPLG